MWFYLAFFSQPADVVMHGRCVSETRYLTKNLVIWYN